MNKQTKRNVERFYHQSVGERFANVKRDNERAEYIQKLLTATDE